MIDESEKGMTLFGQNLVVLAIFIPGGKPHLPMSYEVVIAY